MGIFDRIGSAVGNAVDSVTGGSDSSENDSSDSSSDGGRSIAERTRDAGNSINSGRSDSSSGGGSSGSSSSGRSIAERTRDAGNSINSGRSDSSSGGGSSGSSSSGRSIDRDSSTNSSNSGSGKNSGQKNTQETQLPEEPQEQFGDADLSLGFGGEGDEVEAAADSFARGVNKRASRAGDRLFDGGVSPVTTALRAAGADQAATTYDSGVREFGAGIVQGAGNLVGSVPKLGVEATEAAVFVASDPVEAARSVDDAAAQQARGLARSARRNPARFAGNFVGSAAASGGAFSATQGTRLGTATRAAVQPGEELVKSGVRRGLLGDRSISLTPGVSRGQIDSGSSTRANTPDFSNDLGSGGTGSLFDVDAVDRAQGVSGPSRVAQARGRVRRSDAFDRIRDFSSGEDRAQAQLAGRQQPRGQSRSPEISDDRVTPNLYQQSVDNQLRRQRTVTEGGTFEGEGRPFGADSRRTQAEQDFQALQRRSKRKQNQQPEMTRTPSNDVFSGGVSQGLAAGAGGLLGLRGNQATGVGTDLLDGPDDDTTPDVGTDTTTDQPFDTTQDTGFETGFETEPREPTTNIEPVETGFELNAENSFETGKERKGSERQFPGSNQGSFDFGFGGDEQRFEFEAARDLF